VDERVVYVTGGSRGIGFAVVETLAQAGYSVVAVARRMTFELEELTKTVGTVTFIEADLATQVGQNAVAASLRTNSGLYGLVNNAGVAVPGLHITQRHDSMARMWAVNVEAPFVLCKAAAKAMSRGHNGRIVNISSICAHRAFRGLGVYTATKAALEGFSRVLAAEVGAWGITVNCVAPGFISTDMNASLSEEIVMRIRRRSALSHETTAMDVACTVEFLLSSAAQAVTAEVIRVDSGATA
jgi:3-oxoacyl-[acyl-carrier protein] reductase